MAGRCLFKRSLHFSLYLLDRMSFNVKPFSLELPENGGTTWALLGASRSGKTSLLKYLVRTYYRKHAKLFFTMNPQAPIYESLDPKIIVSPVYHPELLDEMHEINRASGNKFPFLTTFDDYVDGKMKTCPSITRLLTIQRNAGSSAIFSTQSRVLMSSAGRNSINYCLIFKQQTTKQWRDIIEEYLSQYFPTHMSMREMIEFCRLCTEDHAFICIDNIAEEVFISKLNPSQLC